MHGNGDVELVKSPSSTSSSQEGPLARLDRLASGMASLQGLVAGLRERTARPRGADLALERMAVLTAAQAWSDARPGSPAFAVAVAREELRRRLGGRELPAPIHPIRVSTIYRAGSIDSSLVALPALAEGLRATRGELLVADAGADPRTALLPSLLRHLRLMDGGGDAATACNLCVSGARGETVLLLGPGISAFTALPAIGADEVWVGRRAVDSLARWGVGLGPSQPGGAGFDLALPRALWHEAGGLDPVMQDGGGLDLADLCLKLRLLGARLIPWAVSGGHWHAVAAGSQAEAAAEAFRARWGDITVEAEDLA